MAASYLRRDMTGPATFSLYVRNLPPYRGFLVAAGLQACLDALESFSFDEDELGYLRTIGFDEQDVEAFRGVRFDGEVWAVAEGRIVHAGEPIMEITASLPAAQLVETLLLNQVTLHTTVATKAARYRLAAPDKDLVDFAFRRTHGREAAMAVARDSAIVGFTSTSNVEAGAPVRTRCRRNDGALVHRGVPVGDRRVPRVRGGSPRAHDVPGRHVRHAARGRERDRGRPGDAAHRPARHPAGQRRSAGALAGRPEAAGRGRAHAGPHLRERRPGRARGARSGGGRGAAGCVRHRDADGRIGRRTVRGLGVQARRLRRASGAEALRRQGDGARTQAGVARARRRCARRSATSPA